MQWLKCLIYNHINDCISEKHEQTEPKSKAEPDLIWFPSSEPRRRFLKKQEQDGKSCFALQTRDKDALLCRLWLWKNVFGRHGKNDNSYWSRNLTEAETTKIVADNVHLQSLFPSVWIIFTTTENGGNSVSSI